MSTLQKILWPAKGRATGRRSRQSAGGRSRQRHNPGVLTTLVGTIVNRNPARSGDATGKRGLVGALSAGASALTRRRS